MPGERDFILGHWVVSPSLGQISRKGRTVHLEPKTMDLLVRLARRPGQVVSKEDLFTSVWPDSFVSDAVLFKNISLLREALEDHVRNPLYIETIPKRGYRLIAVVEPAADQDHPAGPESMSGRPRPRRWRRMWLTAGTMALLATVATILLLAAADPGRLADTGDPPVSADSRLLFEQAAGLGHDPEPNRQAIHLLDSLVESEPLFAEAWAALSERYYYESAHGLADEQSAERALVAGRRAVELDPGLGVVNLIRTALLVETARPIQAWEIVAGDLRNYPECPEAHMGAAYLYRYMGLLDESLEECERALALGGENRRLRSCAVTAMRLQDYRSAERFIALSDDPEWTAIYSGLMALHQGDADRAAELWREIPRRSPYHGILDGCRESPRSDEARRRLEGFARPTVRDPEAWYLGALILVSCGENQSALHLLSEGSLRFYCAVSAFESETVFGGLRHLPGWSAARRRAVDCRGEFLRQRQKAD